MKTRVALLTLLCLAMAAVPAVAGELYNNGPINGHLGAWEITFGFVISNSFVLSSPSEVTGLSFGSWLFPGDTLTAEVSITSQENGGTTYFDQVVSFSASDCFTNPFGFNVCKETGSLAVNLAAGTFWLNLQNAVDTISGDPVYWDQTNGPSVASNIEIGTIPSESFTILGSAGSGGGTTPEPGSILLLASGILGVAAVVRRKPF